MSYDVYKNLLPFIMSAVVCWSWNKWSLDLVLEIRLFVLVLSWEKSLFTSLEGSATSDRESDANLHHHATLSDRSYKLKFIKRFLSVPLLYHSMGQIIKLVFFVCVCVYVCMYVCMLVCVCGHAYGRIFQPIFTKFGKNLWVWIGRTD